MPAIATRVKDVAYTAAGINVIAFEKANEQLTEQFETAKDRTEELVEKLQNRFDDAQGRIEDRTEFPSHIAKARKAGRAATKDLRSKVDPFAVKAEKRLPEQVAKVAKTSREQVWDLLDAKPAAKAAPAPKAAAKKTPAKKAPARKAAAKK